MSSMPTDKLLTENTSYWLFILFRHEVSIPNQDYYYFVLVQKTHSFVFLKISKEESNFYYF